MEVLEDELAQPFVDLILFEGFKAAQFFDFWVFFGICWDFVLGFLGFVGIFWDLLGFCFGIFWDLLGFVGIFCDFLVFFLIFFLGAF